MSYAIGDRVQVATGGFAGACGAVVERFPGRVGSLYDVQLDNGSVLQFAFAELRRERDRVTDFGIFITGEAREIWQRRGDTLGPPQRASCARLAREGAWLKDGRRFGDTGETFGPYPCVTFWEVSYDLDAAAESGDRPTDAREESERVHIESDEFDPYAHVSFAEPVADLLAKRGTVAPSCVPAPADCRGVWYADPDGYTHPYTGEHTETTAHVEGLSREDAARLHALVTWKGSAESGRHLTPRRRTGQDTLAEETLDARHRPLRAAVDAARATIDTSPEVFAVGVAGRVEGLYVFVHPDDMEAFAQAVGPRATKDAVPLIDRDLAGELIAKERQDNTEECR